MDEQMRDVKLSVDEIKDLMDWLSPEHDGRDFESECPSCTSYRKLSAALSQPAAQGVNAELLEALQGVVKWADDNGRNFKFVAASDSGVVKRIHAAIKKATP